MQDLITFLSHHPLLSLAAASLLILLMIIEFIRANRGRKNLSPLQTTQMINHDHAVIIDLRPNEAYQQGHIIDALPMSAQDIVKNPKKVEKFKTKPIIMVCPTGAESQKIAAILLKRGYNAYALTGGIRAWNEAQMPLVKEKKSG